MRCVAAVLLFLCFLAPAVLTPAVLAHDPPVSPGVAPAGIAPVELNEATVEQLDGLPGIGPALAERIVTYRDEHGPFEQVDDLAKVKGIGVRTLERLRPYLFLQ